MLLNSASTVNAVSYDGSLIVGWIGGTPSPSAYLWTVEGFTPIAGSSQGNHWVAGPVDRSIGPGQVRMADAAMVRFY